MISVMRFLYEILQLHRFYELLDLCPPVCTSVVRVLDGQQQVFSERRAHVNIWMRRRWFHLRLAMFYVIIETMCCSLIIAGCRTHR